MSLSTEVFKKLLSRAVSQGLHTFLYLVGVGEQSFFSILLFLGFNLLFCTQPLSATKKEVVGSPVRPSSMPIPVPSQHHMFSNRQRLLDLDYQVSISPHGCYLFTIMFHIYKKIVVLDCFVIG